MKSKPEKSALKSVPSGVYRHYKGKNYLVLGTARHSETEEALVVYVRLYPRAGCPFWVRPVENFTGMTTDARGKKVKRFTFIGASEPGAE